MIKKFDTLYIHPDLRDHPRAKSLVERIPHRRLETLGAVEELRRREDRDISAAVRRGKVNAALAPYPGRMVEGCPASPGMSCCRYRVVNLISGCPIDCSYCILQGYLNRPTIFIYPELEKVFDEVDRELSRSWGHPLRYGTGELSDSLALDNFTGFSTELVAFFRERPQCTFEFKTKSDRVELLLDAAVRGGGAPENIVVSWSVNPQSVIDTEELLAASLEERLDAARRVQEAGYRLGFHFDPVFRFEGWEEEYRELVERIYTVARPGNVAWISLGCLRYSPWMAPVYRERFSRHPLLAGELHPVPPDGKYRYPQPLRTDVYRRLNGWIRARDTGAYVYLCMESPEVYRWALGREVGGDELAVERGFPPPCGREKPEARGWK